MMARPLEKNKQKIWETIEKHKFIIFFITITAVSLYLRGKLYGYISDDFTDFLNPWFKQLKAGGGLQALKQNIGNYNAPYMTILAILTYLPLEPLESIKTVSVIFDYICAFTVLEILQELLKTNKNKEKYSLLGYAIVVFLPTVFLNSACWGQADSIYTTFILISILFLLKEKYTKAFIFLGIAFSFKLQTVFILPLFILMYISERKFSACNFLIVPIMDFVMCIPAMLFGKSFIDCINVYIGQTNEYSNFLAMNFPNVYSLFFKGISEQQIELIGTTNELVPTIGVWFTICLFIIIAILVLYKKVKFDNRAIIEFGLWCVLISTFFLPHMHDRYLFMGDIIGILFMVFNKEKYYIPLTIEFISLSTYIYYLFDGTGSNIVYFSFLNLILVTVYSKNMYKTYLQ